MITLSDFVASEGSHILGCGLAAIDTLLRGHRISLHHAATSWSGLGFSKMEKDLGSFTPQEPPGKMARCCRC